MELVKNVKTNSRKWRMKAHSFGFNQRQSVHNVKKFYNWTYEDDEERRAIHEWSRKRIEEMHGFRKSYHGFLVYSFHLNTLKSFIQNFNIIVIFQMMLAAGAVYLFGRYEISFDFHVALFVSPIVFPLAFSINTDFQRREKVLDDLANFKSAAMLWFFCMREWRFCAELDENWLNAVQTKVHSMMFNLREYLLTQRLDRRNIIARYMYEDLSDTSQLIERVRGSKLPGNAALISRSLHLLNNMCLSFERLRVIREYRSPRSIRSFNKVLILLLPIFLSPYFVSLMKRNSSEVLSYVLAVIVAGVFGALQGVQDKLDDPFDGMSEDDINLDTIDEWTFTSLDTTAKRNFQVGRFMVSKDINDLETAAMARKQSMAEFIHLHHPTQDGLDGQDIGNASATSTFVRHSPFRKRKTARSLFRRSLKRGAAATVARSQTFATADQLKEKRESNASAYSFSPIDHPFKEVLESMSGEAKITRKHTARHQPILSNRSCSVDEKCSPDEDVYKHRNSESVVSLIKDLKNERANKSESTNEVKFSPENQLITYTPSNKTRHITKIPLSDSPTRQPLLSDNSAHMTNGRFYMSVVPKQTSIDLHELPSLGTPRRDKKNSLLEDDELQEVVVSIEESNHDNDHVFT